MPYRTCEAPFCKNNSKNVKKHNRLVIFHGFPKDCELNQQWKTFCGQDANWELYASSTICSDHFKDEDYQLHRSPLIKNHKNYRVLTTTAVPSVACYQTSLVSMEQIEEERPLTTNDPYELTPHVNVYSVDSGAEQENYSGARKPEHHSKLNQANEVIESLKQDYSKLSEVNEKLRLMLKQYHDESVKLKEKINQLEKELEKKEKTQLDMNIISSIIKENIKSTLSSNQIDLILNIRNRVTWTLEEISSALTLRYFSKRAYKYLASDLHYPLPSLSTLQRHARKINLRQGILEDVITIIGNFTRTFPAMDRECVLSFDEMKVCKIYEYDPAEDEVLGPFDQMQVVMARGLFQKWKQPVYVGFNQKMTKEIVNTLISKLFEKDVNVIAIVSDNASTNIACWKDLGAVVYEKPFFSHPITKNKVYVIPDAPHLLKLIRNWLLKGGFVYNGQKITSDLLHDLVKTRNNSELTPLFKLSTSHIEMTQLEKQNVRKAAELLSRTTAVALRQYYPDNTEAKNLADIIEKIDLWFSVSNSCSPLAKLDYKKSFTGNENQMSALEDMHHFILNMRVIDKSNLETFQKSLLMQITGLKMLFVEMREKHKIKFLSTRKLNQDVLENFFSQIRQIGGVHDHPSPLSCLHRIRLLILGKAPTILRNQTHLNTSLDANNNSNSLLEEENLEVNNENEEYITATLYPKREDMQEPVDDLDNSDILSSVSSNLTDIPVQERDGMEYIIGYIGSKFNKEYPELKLGDLTLKKAASIVIRIRSIFYVNYHREGYLLPQKNF